MQLNVRSEPGVRYPVIDIFTKCQKVSVLKTIEKWSKIDCSEGSGYVFSVYWTKIRFESYVLCYATASDLNIRSGPGTSYAVIDSLGKGEAVQTGARAGKWTEVIYNGQSDYFFPKYLSSRAPVILAERRTRMEPSIASSVNTIDGFF